MNRFIGFGRRCGVSASHYRTRQRLACAIACRPAAAPRTTQLISRAFATAAPVPATPIATAAAADIKTSGSVSPSTAATVLGAAYVTASPAATAAAAAAAAGAGAAAGSAPQPPRINHLQPLASSATASVDGSDVDAIAAAIAAASGGGRQRQQVLDSLVKVYCTASSPNYLLPWQNKPTREVTGSGFAISGRRLLTNAHVVADQKFVQVRRLGSSEKWPATVEAVGHECDLALLTVKDDSFWDGLSALEFGDIPNLQDEVHVVGYPIGGDNVSITRGVVSRVEPQQYAHGAYHLLAIQIDAAINSGNSGGPALGRDGRVIGVAFQNLTEGESLGYIIPVPIIQHFLHDVTATSGTGNRQYIGFCSLGIQCQQTENKYLRNWKGMNHSPSASQAAAKHKTGVLINRVQPAGASAGILFPGDVLLSVDGHMISADGTVHFRHGTERIGFDYLVSLKYSGESVRCVVWRSNAELTIDIRIAPFAPLVPVFQYDQTPSYFIFAGCVFTPLTQPFLHEFGESWYNSAPRRLVHIAMNGIKQFAQQKVVVLSQVLLDEVNAGYQGMAETVVRRVNGTEIRNLQHLTQLIDTAVRRFTDKTTNPTAAAAPAAPAATASAVTTPAPATTSGAAATPVPAPTPFSDDVIVFEMAGNWTIALDIAASVRANHAILTRHRIPADRSNDLKQ